MESTLLITSPKTFNRTSLELKQDTSDTCFVIRRAFNRTSLELKLFLGRENQKIGHSFNRTSLELKQVEDSFDAAIYADF